MQLLYLQFSVLILSMLTASKFLNTQVRFGNSYYFRVYNVAFDFFAMSDVKKHRQVFLHVQTHSH